MNADPVDCKKNECENTEFGLQRLWSPEHARICQTTLNDYCSIVRLHMRLWTSLGHE
jgi:hypothetical protein